MTTLRSIYGRVLPLIEPDQWNDEDSSMQSLERWGDRRFAKANREPSYPGDFVAVPTSSGRKLWLPRQF